MVKTENYTQLKRNTKFHNISYLRCNADPEIKITVLKLLDAGLIIGSKCVTIASTHNLKKDQVILFSLCKLLI
jgi:hypothetical protein